MLAARVLLGVGKSVAFPAVHSIIGGGQPLAAAVCGERGAGVRRGVGEGGR